ncbi:MAG: methylenetetrahydrofolate reductase [Dehalococcoidia bacterium]|nr:methylenetetrahydrofolate reductase [Dehalococcoidia bacterium]
MSLQEILHSGQLAVTTEVIPPKGTDLSKFLAGIRHVRGLVHAVDVADHPRAVARMSNLAMAHLVSEAGCDPILVLTCRDHNVLGLQGTILGVNALGIENVMCVHGDPPAGGDHPKASGVYEVSTTKLISMVRGLAAGADLAGNSLHGTPRIFVGAGADPGCDSLAHEVAYMERKVAAGAQFFQTQSVYDLDTFARFRAATRHLAVPVLAGIFLVESATLARRINTTMRGCHIPEWLIQKLDDSPKPLETMAETAVELARGLATLADGVHIMSLNRLEVVARVIRGAGLA